MLTLMDSNLNLIFTQVKNYFDENYGTVPQQHGIVGPHFGVCVQITFKVCPYMSEFDNRDSCIRYAYVVDKFC